MNTYRIKGIFDESIFKIPKLLSLIGKEVEIIIKKNSNHPKYTSNNNIKKAQEIMSKYIPKNINISDELISERRKEFELE
jgi:hypothetical protein